MDAFKHRSGMWLANRESDLEWQEEYWDHIVRKQDDWRRQVFYVFNNPVRQGLVEDGYQWPFTGSMGMNLKDIFGDAAFD